MFAELPGRAREAIELWSEMYGAEDFYEESHEQDLPDRPVLGLLPFSGPFRSRSQGKLARWRGAADAGDRQALYPAPDLPRRPFASGRRNCETICRDRVQEPCMRYGNASLHAHPSNGERPVQQVSALEFRRLS